MFSKNLLLLVLECSVVTLVFSSLISIAHANREEPATEEPNPDEGAITFPGSRISVMMTSQSTSTTSLKMKSSSKHAVKTSYDQMDKHTLSKALISLSNTGVFTSRLNVPTHTMLPDFATLSVESSHSTVERSPSLPASNGGFFSVNVTGVHHVQTGIVLSHLQSLPVVSEETQSVKTTGLLRHSQYLTVASNETRNLQKSIESSQMQSLPQQTSGLSSRHSQDPFVVSNKTRHLQPSIPSRHMQSVPAALTETLPWQTSSLSRHSENLFVASRQTHHLQAGISSASIKISSQVPVQSLISSVISSPSLSDGRGIILNSTTAFSWTFPLSPLSTSATPHLIEGTDNSTQRFPMLQSSVQSSVVIQTALVGSVSLKFATNFPGLSSLVGSRTIIASQPPSTTSHSVPYSSPWYQSSSVLPLPSPSPPDPPNVQQATALSADSVYLKWNGSRSQVIINFTIELSVNSVTWEQVACEKSLVEEKCVVTQNIAVVVGLQPYTNYTFRVFANSEFGTSNASVGNIWVTTNESVPSHPAQVGVQAVNSSVIFVNWTEPTEMNGVLVKYEVKYSEKASSEAIVVNTSSKSLLLSHLKPYTVYVINVSAFTHAGEGSRVTVLEQTDEAAPSGVPLNVQAITNSSFSIIMRWSPPPESEQNGKILRYNVLFNRAFEEGWTERTDDNSTTLLIANLQAYTNYSFVVQAVNGAGRGPYSSAVSNVTFEAEPSPPRNVTAKSVNSSAVRVSWLKSLHPNGVILYRLYVRISKSDVSANRLVYDGSNTGFVVSPLEEFVTYTFTVESFNVKYEWTSASIIAKETTHPAEPTGDPQHAFAQTLSSSSILVTWDPPLKSEQNGVIILYTVRYTSQSNEEIKRLNTTGNSTSLEVTNLAFYTTYSFSIKAWNAVGSGPWSEPVTNTTFESRPSPPRNLSAKSVNSTAVKVTWIPSQNPNGQIQYRLFYWQSSEGPGAKRQAYDGLALEYVVAGLHEFVAYTFMLLAYNVKYSWSSPAVNSTETTHPAEPAGPPLNVTALANSSTSILVRWSPPRELDRNGIITYYNVIYNLSQGHQGKISITGNTTKKLISNLGKYTVHYFIVQAVNDVGVGPASQPVFSRTFEDVPGAPVITDVQRTSTSLLVTWDPPTEPNGIIVSFNLCWNLEKSNNRSCVQFLAMDKLRNISSLKPYSSYNVSLSANTSVGRGSVLSVIYRTAEGVPSEPRQLQAWNTSESSVFITWKEPANMNGVLERYKVFYKVAGVGELSMKNAGVSTNTSLTQLEPYTQYSITVQAFTKKGGGEDNMVFVMTDETVPSGVTDISFIDPTSNSVKVVWKPPVKPNGNIGYYLRYWRASVADLVIKKWEFSSGVRSKLVIGLKPYVHYTFSVIPYNLRKSLRGPSFNKSMTTEAAAPSGPPLDVKIDNTTSSSITLSWNSPLEPNGEIIGYEVTYYEADPDKKNVHDNVKGQVYTLTGLEPWNTYNIAVACQSTGGIGPHSDWIRTRTDAGAPPPIGTLAPPEEQEITSTTFEVELTKASNKNGDVRYYQVIVRELAKDNKGHPVPPYDPDNYKSEDLRTYDEARRMKPKLVPYIAFHFSASDFDKFKRFTVGDGRESHDTELKSSFRRRRRSNGGTVYYNGPLEEQTFYTVFQRAYVNKDVYTSSSWIDPVATEAAPETSDPSRPGVSSTTKVGLIVGLVFAILIVLVLILVGIIFIRKKRMEFGNVLDDRDDFSNGQPMRMKASRKRRSLQKRLMGSTDSLDALDELAANRARRQPVPIDDFERHVDRMHMDGDHGFSEEYALVQPEEDFSFQQFLNPANKYKNRYANIVAYDHTRVLLNPVEGVAGSDYINANFIDGYNRPRAFIAAQGPLMETFDDFWRMIWEQRTLVIVMLTKLEERGRKKCDKYWPDRGARTYGQVQVTLKEILNMSYYTVRKMTVTHKQFPDEERAIKQFHFTAWPDHGVPSHPTPLLSLVRHVSTSNRDAYGPMVVHCSAGVGRTGTFITLDVMLQKISEEDCIDVFGFVRQMRYQRNYMVQTEAQYVFIHDALLEAITCGVTEVEAKDLSTRLRELRQVDAENGYTYLENEFCRLAKEENHPIAFKSASLNCNTGKNRYANILPFESTRVHLKMRPGEMGSDYINANYIDGYCQPKAYIATQAPVPDTFEDFWRLIWENESAAIVMLTMEEERGKIKCHRYWPSDGGSRLYGVILVELVEEDSYSDYITRKFKLTHTEEKDSRTVRQFQYTDWPDSGLPDSGVGIIDLIGQVQKWQQQSGNTAIVIHCSGGVGRTGVFCAISIMIERLKAEGVVDVFQTVQAMRLQRPAMVQTAEQYEFCYTTLQEYLDSFDLYANFQ